MIRFLIRLNCINIVRSQCNQPVPIPKPAIADYAPVLKPSFNLAAFANQSHILQQFIKLGVDLSKFDKNKDLCNYLIGLDFERNVQPHIRFLCDHGVRPEHLGLFLTRNPLILRETLDDLQTRINYLMYKGFETESISRILTLNPKWLSVSTPAVDSRFRFLHEKFALVEREVRQVATRCPRLITATIDAIESVQFSVREEMCFDADECKYLLLNVPKVFTMRKCYGFDFVRKVSELSYVDFDLEFHADFKYELTLSTFGWIYKVRLLLPSKPLIYYVYI